MKLSSLAIATLSLFSLLCFSHALNCYTCAVTASSGDKKCIDDPANVEGRPVVTCTKRYCTIFRQELKDPAGKVNSFTRGCEDEPIFLDEVVEDELFITYYRSCTTDLCNSDDGVESGGEYDSPQRNGGENLIIAGKTSAAPDSRRLFPALLLAATFSIFSRLIL